MSSPVDVISQLKKKAVVYVTWLLDVLSKDTSAEYSYPVETDKITIISPERKEIFSV